MKNIIRLIWRNKTLIIAAVQAAKKYGPPAYDYVKEKMKKTIKKVKEWTRSESKD